MLTSFGNMLTTYSRLGSKANTSTTLLRSGSKMDELLYHREHSRVGSVGPSTLTSPCIYDCLDTGRKEFRILVIHPGRGSEPLRTRLLTTNFEAKPDYQALSYTWGSGVHHHVITLNGRTFTIGENLWQALHWLRNVKIDVHVWADALCINQDDLVEKSQQVPLMAFIYERSSCVLAWTGTDLDNTKQTLESNYWNRVWIVQELCMAEQIKFAGRRGQFHDWEDIVKTNKAELDTQSNKNHKILKIDDIRRMRHTSRETYYLSNLVREFQDSFCTESRDKVYGFLGMASDYLADGIHVDYTKPVAEIYRDVVEFQNLCPFDNRRKRVELLNSAALIRQVLVRRWQEQNATLTTNRHVVKRKLIPFIFWPIHLWLDKQIEREKAKSGQWEFNELLLVMIFVFLVWYLLFAGALVEGFIRILLTPVSFTIYLLRVAYARVSGPRLTLYSRPYWLKEPIFEDFSAWARPNSHGAKQALVTIGGRIVGTIEKLGPSHNDLVQDPLSEKMWATALDVWILTKAGKEDELPAGLKGLRGRNHRLMRTLTDSSAITHTYRVHNFVSDRSPSLQASKSHANVLIHDPWDNTEDDASRVFVGAIDDASVLGLVPGGALPGDSICQFWNSSAAAVVRLIDGVWTIIGRAGVLTQDEGPPGWEVLTDQQPFMKDDQRNVDIVMDVNMLTSLSMDTVQLPGS